MAAGRLPVLRVTDCLYFLPLASFSERFAVRVVWLPAASRETACAFTLSTFFLISGRRPLPSLIVSVFFWPALRSYFALPRRAWTERRPAPILTLPEVSRASVPFPPSSAVASQVTAAFALEAPFFRRRLGFLPEGGRLGPVWPRSSVSTPSTASTASTFAESVPAPPRTRSAAPSRAVSVSLPS